MLSTIALATASTDATISFLKEKKLLASRATCVCGQDMNWIRRSDVSDGWQWRCTKSDCRRKQSIRSGSYFTKSRLPLPILLRILYCWAAEVPVTQLHALVKEHLSEKTAVQHYSYVRDVCSAVLTSNPTKLGGAGIVVQIDESLFRHGRKVSFYGCSKAVIPIVFL